MATTVHHQPLSNRDALLALVHELRDSSAIPQHNKEVAQKYLRTHNHSKPSQESVVKAFQAMVGSEQDGLVGDKTIRSFQSIIGGSQSGTLDEGTKKALTSFLASSKKFGHPEQPHAVSNLLASLKPENPLHEAAQMSHTGLVALKGIAEPPLPPSSHGQNYRSALAADQTVSSTGVTGLIYTLNKNAHLNRELADGLPINKTAPAKAPDKSTGLCAGDVTFALANVGKYIGGDAKDLAHQLPANGYQKINHTPQQLLAGDIAFLPPQGPHADGHIACYDGTKWVSDFTQPTHALSYTWSDISNPKIEYFRDPTIAQQAAKLPPAKIDAVIHQAKVDAVALAQKIAPSEAQHSVHSSSAKMKATAAKHSHVAVSSFGKKPVGPGSGFSPAGT